MHGNTVVAFLNAHARCVLGQLRSCTLQGREGAPITLRDRRRAARRQESAHKRRKVRFERFVRHFTDLRLESACRAGGLALLDGCSPHTGSPAPPRSQAAAPSFDDGRETFTITLRVRFFECQPRRTRGVIAATPMIFFAGNTSHTRTFSTRKLPDLTIYGSYEKVTKSYKKGDFFMVARQG